MNTSLARTITSFTPFQSQNRTHESLYQCMFAHKHVLDVVYIEYSIRFRTLCSMVLCFVPLYSFDYGVVNEIWHVMKWCVLCCSVTLDGIILVNCDDFG